MVSYWVLMGIEFRIDRDGPEEVNQRPVVLGLASSGIGYALLPQSVSKLRTAGVAYRPLTENNAPCARLVAAWRTKEPNPTTSRFIDLLHGMAG